MKKNFLIIIMLSCLVALQLWFLFLTFHYAYYGVHIDKNTQNEWVITDFDKVSKGTFGLQVGDILLKVDGKDPNKSKMIKFYHEIEQVDTVTILRGGIEKEMLIKHNKRLNSDYISLFGELFCFCIACLIYLKIPKSKSAQLLIMLFIFMGIICMCIPASSRGDNMAKMLLNVPLTALPIIFLHFLFVFFNEKSSIRLSYTGIFWGYSFVALKGIITCIFCLTPFFTYEMYKMDRAGVILIFLIGLFVNLFVLVYIYFKYKKVKPSIKSIIKFIWFAFFVSCAPLAFLSFIPFLLLQKPIIEPIYTCFFILLFPVSFVYMIITKQLFDVQIIIRRILYTTSISMIPSLFIVILQAFIFIQAASIQKLLFSFLIILMIISFLLYILEYFSTKLDAIIFPRKYQLQNALKKIAQNLKSIKSFRELKEIILVDIVNTLQVSGGAIVFKYKDGIETIGEGNINLTEIEQAFIADSLDKVSYSIFEINHNEDYASFLITTTKKNNTILSLEETQWLGLIITYLAVSMENLYLIRKLTMRLLELASQIPNKQAGQDFVWLRKSLFELQERERFRIATDLHDTTMQDILLIKKRLVNYMEYGEDRQELLGIIKHLELINDSLRQSCFELNPFLLQRIGLVKTIEAALELDLGTNEIEINFYVEDVEAIESFDLEVKKHIFRIIQEMIQNAKKHSMATEVTLKLSIMEGYTCLFYNDNGVGMDAAELNAEGNLRKITSSGLGLEQMKNRIIYLNGHLELESKINQGVRITVRIPNQLMYTDSEFVDAKL